MIVHTIKRGIAEPVSRGVFAEVCDARSDTLLAPTTIGVSRVELIAHQEPDRHAPVCAYC